MSFNLNCLHYMVWKVSIQITILWLGDRQHMFNTSHNSIHCISGVTVSLVTSKTGQNCKTT